MKHRYTPILILILVLLLFQMGAADNEWTRTVTILLEGAILVAVFHASAVHRAMRRGAEVAAVLATLAAVITLLGVGDEAPEAHQIINVLVIALAPVAIGWGVLNNLREHQGVTVQAVVGVLCVYLLVGMIFASLYGAVANITDEPFFANDQANSISDFLYFSFTTLTTTGYGDLAPDGNLGRSVAIMEQLIGAIYLVTVVAVMVANLRPRSA